MKDTLKRIFNKLPNNYKPYHCWYLWILVAGIKTWLITDFKTARNLYWSR